METGTAGMTLTAWDKSIETGFFKIDEEHRIVAGAFVKLRQAVEKKADRGELTELLDDLLRKLMDHFRGEEALMDTYAYPKANAHKSVHARQADQLEELREWFLKRKNALTLPVIDLFDDWMTDHIAKDDLELARFIRSRSTQPRTVRPR